MDNFTFYCPTCFVFGRETENQAGALVRRFGGTRALIHYGGGSAVRSGLIDRVRASLEKEGVSCVLLGGVRPNPRSGLVYEGIELCRREKIDFVLAVGGGSSIDSSKAIAAGTVYDGDFWDFFSGKCRMTSALPVGAVLTIAAAGSEGSSGAVITQEETLLKRSGGGDAIRPKFSIMNPALTQTLPPYQTASGVADIMAHLYERYLTNTADVEVTDRLLEALMLTLIHEGPRVMEDPNNYDARANIMWAGMMAHNNACGVGRSQDWNSHSIEHELSAFYDCAHGAGLAVTMPAVFRHVMEHDVMRFAQVAVRVWGCQMDFAHPETTARAGIEALSSFLTSLGMPKSLTELGGREEDIPALVESLCRGGGRDGTITGFVTLNEADCAKIYRAML